MEAGRVRGRAGIGLLALLAAALVVVQASVFVYYTTNYTLAPTAPPVYLAAGDNAGKPDLYGNTITVTVGQAGASANVTLHPTYGKNYYKGILNIVNQDTNAYNVTLRLTDPLSDTKVASAYMYVYDPTGALKATLDLKASAGTATQLFTISGGVTYRVDVVIVIDEAGGSPNAAPSLTDTTFKVELVYSPSGETPP